MLNVAHLNALVIQDLSCQVANGETLAVMGRSGVGKTTLLRCIAGLQAYTGNITYDGPIGYAEQTVTLLPHMTVEQNIALPLTLKHLKPNITEVANKCQIEHLLKRYPGNLSGGEQQRVQLARALVLKPKLLLLDEPFRSLDAYTRDELLVWLKQLLQDYKPTTIFVTHDQREAAKLTHRVLNLSKLDQNQL